MNHQSALHLQGMNLPQAFACPDSHGLKGGVDAAFVSTTADKKVAISYLGSENKDVNYPRTILEIGLGQVRGRVLMFLFASLPSTIFVFYLNLSDF